uniref:tRNA/rRNA methyltransferase SpoU type domain-containing protein n=1 Tax=Kalanchoe fedtschenkoi TaxID=63787 RepID=A0A7N0T933_KALFE
MCACKTLVRMSICSFESKIRTSAAGTLSFSVPIYLPCFPPLKALRCVPSLRRSVSGAGGFLSVVAAAADYIDEGLCDESEGLPMDALEKLLTTNKEEMSRFMKMERKRETSPHKRGSSNWFPYLNVYKVGETILTSGDVLEALSPYIMETRKERLRVAVQNRTYSVCLVIEGLNDVGNASAIFRSADALGFQSVHVISFDCSKRFRENRNVSVGAEKWLDIELWDSTKECFDALKSRGYCIAATHVETKAVSVYEVDWSGPTAIVVGNETRGISKEALELADIIFSIPMKGMVESFNVSVASALIMHHALCDRTSRLGCHGDLTPLQQQILLAEFSLRHSNNAVSIVHEHSKRKVHASKL